MKAEKQPTCNLQLATFNLLLTVFKEGTMFDNDPYGLVKFALVAELHRTAHRKRVAMDETVARPESRVRYLARWLLARLSPGFRRHLTTAPADRR